MQLIPTTRRRLTPAELAGWRAFLQAHATLERLADADLTEAGAVPLSWYGILLVLSQAPPHGLRLSELAERVALTKSGMSRLVDRVEERGLVQRRTCPTDGRGQYAALTAAGRRALRRSAPTHLRTIARRFADRLSAEELATLTAACERLAS